MLWVLVLLGCGPSEEDKAAAAAQLGNHALAAEHLTRAAVKVGCPARGELLLQRADAEEAQGLSASVRESLDAAIRNCPDNQEAWWRRARHAVLSGDREQAMEDAGRLKDSLPEAAALYSELAMELAMERSRTDRSHHVVGSLKEQLDLEAGTQPMPNRGTAQLARQIPVPVSLRYKVRQVARSPKQFELDWEELWSFRGQANESTYTLVRSLELPLTNRELPVYFRLQMSNQRLPMRFRVDSRGEIVEADWLRDGPDRGMRPQMLRPEIQGQLKRRRVYDPGERGDRRPGEKWSGEDVRVVDGRPVELSYEAVAEEWQSVLGIETLKITTTLSGEGYKAVEHHWIHPQTAIAVRWSRQARYEVTKRGAVDTWDEQTDALLVSVAGVD